MSSMSIYDIDPVLLVDSAALAYRRPSGNAAITLLKLGGFRPEHHAIAVDAPATGNVGPATMPAFLRVLVAFGAVIA